MRKHIQKLHVHVKKHLTKPAETHHYIAFMVILAGFAILSVGAFVTYAADENVCDDCVPTSVVDTIPDIDIVNTDGSSAKVIVKLKINTLPVYQKLYGKNSKEVRSLKKLITSLTKLHNENTTPTKELITSSIDENTPVKRKTILKKTKVKDEIINTDAPMVDNNKSAKESVKEPIRDTLRITFTKTPKTIDPLPPLSTSKKAMTWVARDRAQEGVINVGSDSTTNAYQGDTDINTLLSMLCVNKQDMVIPEVLAQEYELRLQNDNRYDDAFYNGWIGGYVKITTPIVGSMITSHDVANKICVNQLGEGWEFAEHHSPQGGRGRFAYGDLPTGQRFWVGINDQPANPWGAGW